MEVELIKKYTRKCLHFMNFVVNELVIFTVINLAPKVHTLCQLTGTVLVPRVDTNLKSVEKKGQKFMVMFCSGKQKTLCSSKKYPLP